LVLPNNVIKKMPASIKIFGKRLQEARVNKGLNQFQLAEKMNLKQTAISNYEKGISEPSFDKLIKLTKILGVSLDYLLGQDSKWEFIEDMDEENLTPIKLFNMIKELDTNMLLLHSEIEKLKEKQNKLTGKKYTSS